MMSVEKKEQDPESRLHDFRNEIKAIAETEGQEGKTAHFQGENSALDVNDLTIDDMNLWTKIKDGSITRDDLKEHDQGFYLVEEGMRKGRLNIPLSRKIFRAFAANRASSILAERQLADLGKSKR